MRPGPQRPLLERNTERGYIGGVCAGLADYAGVDRTWVRAAFVFAGIFGSGEYRALPIMVYLVLWVAVPKRPALENAPPTGVRFLILALLVSSLPLTAMAMDARISGGLAAAPVLIAIAAAVIRLDSLRAKALLVAIGLALSTTLFVMNYQPTTGARFEKPHGMAELRGTRPYTTVLGDLTIDLSALSVSGGSIRVPVVAEFSDLTLLVPEDRNLTVEKNGQPVYVQSAMPSAASTTDLTINVDFDGFFSSLRVERVPAGVLLQP
jgi:phage shock protein PspC (stress-responsive transcriptional regulator)